MLVYSLLSDKRGEVVPNNYKEIAKIEWKTLSSDMFVIHGRKLLRDEFLPDVGIFNRSVTIQNLESKQVH